MNNKIINDNNYRKFVHYLESNLLGLSALEIYKYRIMSSLKCLLYIEKKGNLIIEEKGTIHNKRTGNENDYILAKMENSDYRSLYLKSPNKEATINLSNHCVIRHKLFKDFYLVYPYLESDNKTLKVISKEGKINLFITLITIIIAIIGFLSLLNVI